MKIDETDSVEWSNGDPGYLLRGHLDKDVVMAAIVEFEQEEYGSDAEEHYVVSHRYVRDATPKEAKASGYEANTFFCDESTSGAYAVTVAMP